jgi:hypothetical protein
MEASMCDGERSLQPAPTETPCAGCEAANEWLAAHGFTRGPERRPRDVVEVLDDLAGQLDRRNRQLFARRQDRASYRDEIRNLQRSRDRWRRRAERNWSDARQGRALQDDYVRDTVEMGRLAEYLIEEMHAEPPDGKDEHVCASAVRILRGLVAVLEPLHDFAWDVMAKSMEPDVPPHKAGERPEDCTSCRALRGKVGP